MRAGRPRSRGNHDPPCDARRHVRHREADLGGAVALVGHRKGRDLIIAVRDTGPGIRTSEREVIFEPFHRSDSNVAGTGLGLAIVRGIIEQHGGRVWVDSGPEGGSTFWVALPTRSETENHGTSKIRAA
jgi:signal transduction histidine kinase